MATTARGAGCASGRLVERPVPHSLLARFQSTARGQIRPVAPPTHRGPALLPHGGGTAAGPLRTGRLLVLVSHRRGLAWRLAVGMALDTPHCTRSVRQRDATLTPPVSCRSGASGPLPSRPSSLRLRADRAGLRSVRSVCLVPAGTLQPPAYGPSPAAASSRTVTSSQHPAWSPSSAATAARSASRTPPPKKPRD